MESRQLSSCLEGSRIQLIKNLPEHADVMFRGIDADRTRLRVFLPWVDSIRTVQDERDFLESSLQRWEQKDLFNYGVYLKDSAHTYLGNIGVHNIRWTA